MALLAPSGIMNRRGFRSSSVAAYPIPQASLALWLKADAGVTVNGSNVTEWADQSGNGLNVVPDTETSDISLVSSVAKFNNKPAILFGVSDISGGVGLFNNNPFITKSVFLVYSLEGVNGFEYSVIYENNGINCYTSYGNGNRAFGGYFNDFVDSNTASTLGTAYIRTVISDDDGEGNNPINFFTNGASDGVRNGNGFYNFRSEIVIGNGGARSLGPSPSIDQPFQGYIAEVVAYSAVLTEIERQEVEAYLMDKYAITPPPSGIPVASTSSITISGYGTFAKRVGGETITGDGLTIYDGVAYTNLGSNPTAYVLFGPPPTYAGDMGPNQFSEWTLYSVGAYEGGDTNAWLNGTLIASSTSNDINTIPTTGWSPAITITAA